MDVCNGFTVNRLGGKHGRPYATVCRQGGWDSGPATPPGVATLRGEMTARGQTLVAAGGHIHLSADTDPTE
jgi:hypothetical protein